MVARARAGARENGGHPDICEMERARKNVHERRGKEARVTRTEWKTRGLPEDTVDMGRATRLVEKGGTEMKPI